MEIRKIGVVGAGQMGSGIAQVAAQAGYEVVLRDLEGNYLERGLSGIRRSLGKLLEKGKLDQQGHDAALSRIRTTLELRDLAGCDLVVEA
ncbi:3-hydroxyacyl-CoA dehydrogenase NAD-binding domain-containing protein, partial [Escherichia coli]|nr:3-hydroxyacyl-CoA dehydrogenase NAD-binding domain-containing protein [Escherichia coli]